MPRRLRPEPRNTGHDQAGRAADFVDSIDPKQTFVYQVVTGLHLCSSGR